MTRWYFPKELIGGNNDRGEGLCRAREVISSSVSFLGSYGNDTLLCMIVVTSTGSLARTSVSTTPKD